MTIRTSSYIFIILLALILPAFSILAYNLYIDPFQIVHKNYNGPAILLGGRGTDRYQHAGIINNYPVHSFILGDSQSANFIPSKLEKEMNLSYVRSLTMDGATLSEQVFPARHALNKGEVSYILWGISHWKLMQAHDARNSKMSLPEYLYDRNPINDLRFFMTFDLHKYHMKKLLKLKSQLKDLDWADIKAREFDRATAWYWGAQESFNRPVYVAKDIFQKNSLTYGKVELAPVSLESIHKRMDFQSISAILEEKAIENIRRNICVLVEAFPDTMFDFMFIPFPTLSYQMDKIYRKTRYIKCLLVMEKFVVMMAEYPNVRIFAFGLERFPDDLRLYKDSWHYHIEVNNYIIEKIADNKNRLTSENLADYIRLFDQKVTQYRLPGIWNPLNAKVTEKGSMIDSEKARSMIQGRLGS